MYYSKLNVYVFIKFDEDYNVTITLRLSQLFRSVSEVYTLRNVNEKVLKYCIPKDAPNFLRNTKEYNALKMHNN